MNTTPLPAAVEEYLAENRSELVAFLETLVGFDTQNPPGRTVDAVECVVDDPVFRRSATGGGDAKVLRHSGVPTVEFGFGTQTAHGTDEYTTTEELVRNATAYAALPQRYASHEPALSG
ncbi:MAG: hypothetical protein V5A39_08660 [Haloarculaceae archaeon]